MADKPSTKGWNWGYYKLENDRLEFIVDNSPCFSLLYQDILTSNANGKNEVALEF